MQCNVNGGTCRGQASGDGRVSTAPKEAVGAPNDADSSTSLSGRPLPRAARTPLQQERVLHGMWWSFLLPIKQFLCIPEIPGRRARKRLCAGHSEGPVRKLRRLPWRLPKQTPAPSPAVSARPHRVERDEVIERERPVLTQPVAYTGGRYVYGSAPSVEQSSDARRGRHRGGRAANIR